MGFTGMLKGVSSFNIMHVKMQVFMVMYPSYIRKGYLFGVGICCTVCQEGTIVSKHGKHVLKASFSGKTSLISSLAGELGLDICVLNMSSKGCVNDCSHYSSVIMI